MEPGRPRISRFPNGQTVQAMCVAAMARGGNASPQSSGPLPGSGVRPLLPLGPAFPELFLVFEHLFAIHLVHLGPFLTGELILAPDSVGNRWRRGSRRLLSRTATRAGHRGDRDADRNQTTSPRISWGKWREIPSTHRYQDSEYHGDRGTSRPLAATDRQREAHDAPPPKRERAKSSSSPSPYQPPGEAQDKDFVRGNGEGEVKDLRRISFFLSRSDLDIKTKSSQFPNIGRDRARFVFRNTAAGHRDTIVGNPPAGLRSRRIHPPVPSRADHA